MYDIFMNTFGVVWGVNCIYSSPMDGLGEASKSLEIHLKWPYVDHQ